ncbi:MAG: glycosyltransferase [Oscillospiraceae bacterium]|nr:glycosyltransferase [Oscillospiraceae bacterium]
MPVFSLGGFFVKYIVCLSGKPWSSIPSRTQHLMTRMKGVQVLFFQPAANRRDRSWRKPGRKVRPEVTVYTLPPLATREERLPFFFRWGQRRQARYIQRLLDRQRVRNYLLWTTSPVHVHLLDRLSYDALVYDCDRDWADLPEHWEGSLAKAADVVFAASPNLLEQLSPCSSNIALLPNGVNYSLFANTSTTPTPLLPKVDTPIFCWSGVVHEDLDLSPVVYTAAQRPEWTFLFVGRTEKDNPFLERLRRFPNVIFAGERPLMELPDWLGRSDVCINLLRRDAPDSDIIPSRIYEYLSTGKPIVSMLWPEQVEQFPDVVYAAYTEQSFAALCQRALDEDRSWVADRRRAYGEQAAWPKRAEAVLQLLNTTGLL